MKYLLIMQGSPHAWEAMTEDERTMVMNGHGGFARTVQETGELIGTEALADPSNSVVVRVRDGVPVVTDGPFGESEEVMGGYYLVECESRGRAVELATMIPDARVEGLGVEVRPVMFPAGLEM